MSLKLQSRVNQAVLVLNKTWQALHVTSVRRALSKAATGRALLLDTTNDSMLTFEEWIQLPILDENKAIRGGRFSIRQPEVMVTLEYNRFPERDVKLNKKNLWLRDEKVCQYTGKSLTYDEASLDHVFPQSKGGLSTWENMVICCREVNSRKADRTPEEAGLKLRKKPIRPKWHPKYARYSSLITPNSPESWKRYVSIDAMI